MGTTTNLALPYPELSDSADVPRDVKALADAIDALSVAPPGVIQMWPGGAAPTGWFICNGQLVSEVSNPKLAALFGAAGGTVPLPDLRGRLLAGAETTRPLRSTGGASTVLLSAAQSGIRDHAHDDSLAVANAAAMNTGNDGPDHTHNYAQPGPSALVTGSPSGSSLARAAIGGTTAGANQRHAHTLPAHGHGLNGTVGSITGANRNAAATTAHENMPPYYAINFIIRAG